MKKTATLLAGLLLVTGTVFAANWDVTTATVEGDIYLLSTENGSLGTSAGDLNFKLEAVKSGDFGTLTTTIAVDKASEDQTAINFAYEKTEGDFTIGIGADVATTDGAGNTATWAFKTNESSDAYIAWNVMGSETVKFTYYPYEVDGMSWDNDTWESFAQTSDPGFALDLTLSENTTVTTKVAVANGDSNTKNSYTAKLELSTVVAGASVSAAVGASSYNAVATDTTKNTMLVAASVSKDLTDTVSVSAEYNMEKVEDTDALTGIYVYGSADLEEVNGYKPTAYAALTLLNDMAANYDNVDSNGAFTELEVGLDMAQGNITVTPYVVFDSREEKAYSKEDSLDTSKTATTVAVSLSYSF
ncbi:MAG: hypothetical protein JG768_1603 [Fusobacteriales bacterium]|nr:hypothetical protein [Fusobacteriales bacterium]